jgi:hypothetical protein
VQVIQRPDLLSRGDARPQLRLPGKRIDPNRSPGKP